MTAPEPSFTILDQALRYLALGLSVIPIKPRDKRPALASWKEYQKRLPTEAEVRNWFTTHPGLNLAIVTGAVSRVVVVDADNPEAVTWLGSHHPSPMRTKTSKGIHGFFLHPGHEVRNGAKLIGMALDVRGDGGYVVAPGSVHPTGAVYEEEGDWHDPDSLPTFQASWLGEKVQPLVKPQVALENRVRAYLDKIPGEPEGSRDSTGFRVACKLVREFALTDESALFFLGDWNARCAPPMSEQDLRRLVASAGRSGRAPIGIKLIEQPTHTGHWTPPVPAAPGTSVDEGGPGNLQELLSQTDKGAVRKTPGNLAKILRLDPEWGAYLALNEMTRDVMYRGQPVGDTFTDWVQEVLEDHYGVAWGRDDVQAKIVSQATLQTVHPVRTWLRTLPAWDGTERIRRIAPEILRTAGAEMEFQFIMRTLVGAVRRVLEPGTKMDTILVLVGVQGAGKSTFWSSLCGGQWFGDSPIDLESKDGPMVIGRRWCTEIPEIDHATSTRSAERVKAFISSSEDTFRPPFGKSVQVFKRSCFIVGTTNRDGFLTDATGSRRFWPIKVLGPVDLVTLAAWREQVWAEALNLSDAGAPHWLDAGMEAARAADAGTFEAEDPWDEQVEMAIGMIAKTSRSLSEGVTLAELMDGMGITVGQQTRGAAMKLAEILKRKGWVRCLAGLKRTSAWRPNA